MKLSFKPVRASRAAGFQGSHGGSQLVLTLYRMYFFCFQMCNCLPEMMKNGDAGIFPVYYSVKYVALSGCWIVHFIDDFLSLITIQLSVYGEYAVSI